MSISPIPRRLTRKGKRRLAGFLVGITDIHAPGLPATDGLTPSRGFYRDPNDAARNFANPADATHHAD